MTRKHVIVPPFRDLDPELEVAERLLAQGNPWLAGVVAALPDEQAAANRLGDLVAGASGLAELVAFGGWRRIKRCAVCAQAFCDRTSGCSRRWCAGHRPHAESRSSGVH